MLGREHPTHAGVTGYFNTCQTFGYFDTCQTFMMYQLVLLSTFLEQLSCFILGLRMVSVIALQICILFIFIILSILR